MAKIRAAAGVTVGILAIALTLGAALAAAAAWVGWWQPPSLPTDAEAASLAGRLVPGPTEPLATQRRDVVFEYGAAARGDRPTANLTHLLLGGDDYDAGFVRVTTAATTPDAAMLAATGTLRADGWELRSTSAVDVTAELGRDFVELYPSDTAGRTTSDPAAITLLMRRAEPRWVPYACLGGWAVGLLLGGALFLRAHRRRARRTLLALAVPGVLALLPGTVITSGYVLLYLTRAGPAFPDPAWGGYMFWLIKPASIGGVALLLLAALVTLVSRRRVPAAEPAEEVPGAERAEAAKAVPDTSPDGTPEVGKPEPVDVFIKHDKPAWRARADFVINAALPGRYEQIWAKQVADDEFEVCCIPFQLQGVALGDVVRTAPSGGLKYVFERVLRPSGRHVFTVFFTDPLQPQQETLRELVQLGALIEYAADDVLAVDARDDGHAHRIEQYLRQAQSVGDLGFEVARESLATPASAGPGRASAHPGG